MSRINIFLQELDREAITTRKMLERVPNDKYDWKPHEKSMSIRQLATHIAELPSWVGMALTTDELDFATTEYKPKQINNTTELVAYFESELQEGKLQLQRATEDQLDQPWTMRNGEQIYDVSPKCDVIRMTYSQIIHHRAQLGVYLRLLNVPIPGSYGPSADEQ
jgi:uncharacterized damage-inducible protein DinB